MDGNKWMEKVDQNLEKLKMDYKDIEVKDKREKIIKFYVDEGWKEELNKRPTAKINHMRKRDIKQEKTMTIGIP